MTRFIAIFILTVLLFSSSFASHNRGGEITYVHLGGNTYEITITTCTDIGPEAQADRNELYIDYGDGFKDTLPRIQTQPQPFNHQINTYKAVHTFSSAGTYTISMEDPNRNNGILNINGGNSDGTVFHLQSELRINPFAGNKNNSIQFDRCPCPAIACVGKIYCYNPLVVDPDGDSLSFELVAPLGGGGIPLGVPTTYQFPFNLGGGTGTVDPVTGTFCWDAPGMIGEFNFTYKISEWRNGIKVGHVYHDVQLTVDGNCTNNPPTISAPQEICVTAGDNINFNVTANDQDGDLIALSGSGNPFSVSTSPSSFPNVSANGSVTSNFNWNTECSHIKPGSYQVLFAVQDNGDPVFSNYASTQIKIIPPTVTNVTAAPFGNGVNLTWDQTTCNNSEGYHIYRTTNSGFSFPPCCENPSPTAEGFDLVGTVFDNSTTTFYDNTSLTLGITYCYVVTAFYSINQVESCPSDAACAKLKKEVPIITHATVNETDVTLGIDSVMWSKPTELDTIQFPGPYHYKVYHGNSFNNINTLVGQTAYGNFLYQTDTIFTVSNLNTADQKNFFRVELFYTNTGNDSLVGSSNSGGTIFLTTISNDNQIELKWTEDVPWINTNYEVYRSLSSSGPFGFIGSSTTQNYIDVGLINGTTYCYYVKSIGSYSSTSIISPIENLSQISCEVPIDKTPPCPPILSLNGDCEIGENELIWNNPNNTGCADDVMSYDVYFTPVYGEEFEQIASVNSSADTLFTHNNLGSVAGCYYVTATDSLQYSNESDSSNIVCFDNCPSYSLPNVFTPNGDGNNDLYHAILPYKYVESVEMQIYNRWGQIIFETSDPDINWDGKHKDTNTPVPDGVYYYICTVNTIRLSGIEPLVLTGFIHVFDNEGTSGN